MEGLNKSIHVLYNLSQLVILPPLFPLLTIFALSNDKYKDSFLARLGFGLKKYKSKGTKRIWIHTLSLGEFHGATSLIKGIKREFKDLDIVLSASTKTGLMAIKKSNFSKDSKVISAPYDINFVTKKFINYIKPDLFILVETDIWPNLLWGLKKKGTKIILVNGSISSKATKKLSNLPFLASYLYDPFTFLGMQSDDDVRRLKSLGIKKNILKIGNIKFDLNLKELPAKEKRELIAKAGFNESDKIFIAGSTHKPEEKVCIDIFYDIKRKIPNLKLIIAPRDIKRGLEIKNMCLSKGLRACLRTEKAKNSKLDVTILDTFGELAKFYNICHVAFVGGSLSPVGGHNILEPIFLGKPVIFGPHMESFREIALTVHKTGAGVMVNNAEDLSKAIFSFLTNEKIRKKAKEKGQFIIRENKGSVKKYLDIISSFLEQ